MATVNMSSRVNMADDTVVDGFITSINSGLLRLEDNPDTTSSTIRQDYSGSFVVGSSTLPGGSTVPTINGGTITGFSESTRPGGVGSFSEIWNITGLNANAVAALNALDGSVSAYYSILFANPDTFNGSSQDDVIIGYDGGDTMNGNNGNDAVQGLAGHDVLNGGGGADTLFGDGGTDTAVYAGSRASHTLTKTATGYNVGGGTDGGDVLRGVERIQFSDQTVKVQSAPTRDVGGDGNGDILWRNATTGDFQVWQMNGGTPLVQATVAPGLTNAWQVRDMGDFNGDGKSDLMWRQSDGHVAIWTMNGSAVTSSPVVARLPDWTPVATEDFNGDFKSDILWRHNSGTVAIWNMDGATPTATPIVAGIGNDWRIVDTADFNGDFKSDILWQHNNGSVAIWYMDNATPTSTPIVANFGNAWNVQRAADFNADGKADLLWTNAAGQTAMWLMDGSTVPTATPIVAALGNAWRLAGAEDYSGDGRADILWHNTNGTLSLWQMDGSSVIASPVVGNLGSGWVVS